jgi:hypothetical protein
MTFDIAIYQSNLSTWQGIKKSADAAGMGRHSQKELESLICGALQVNNKAYLNKDCIFKL